jgi:hypothetical protein
VYEEPPIPVPQRNGTLGLVLGLVEKKKKNQIQVPVPVLGSDPDPGSAVWNW